jgi:hypothetical protein
MGHIYNHEASLAKSVGIGYSQKISKSVKSNVGTLHTESTEEPGSLLRTEVEIKQV